MSCNQSDLLGKYQAQPDLRQVEHTRVALPAKSSEQLRPYVHDDELYVKDKVAPVLARQDSPVFPKAPQSSKDKQGPYADIWGNSLFFSLPLGLEDPSMSNKKVM